MTNKVTQSVTSKLKNMKNIVIQGIFGSDGATLMSDSNPIATKLTGSNVPDTTPIPQKIVKRKQSFIQTHNAVNVAPNGNSEQSTWIDTDGYENLTITMLSDTGTNNNSANVRWSNDGVSGHGFETVIASGLGSQRTGITPTKARYAKIQITNADASNPHTMSAWAYLKS